MEKTMGKKTMGERALGKFLALMYLFGVKQTKGIGPTAVTWLWNVPSKVHG